MPTKLKQTTTYNEESDEQKRLNGLERTLDRLYKLRDLEITNLWQRSVFLAVFLTLILTAYGILVSKLPEKESNIFFLNIGAISLSCIGIVFSLIWILMGKASKAWFEVSENAVARFEELYWEDLGLPNNGKVMHPDTNFRMGMMEAPEIDDCLSQPKAGAYSPSKLNIIIGYVFWTIWVIIFIVHATWLGYDITQYYAMHTFDCSIFGKLFISCITAIVLLILYNHIVKKHIKNKSKSSFLKKSQSIISKINLIKLGILKYEIKKRRKIRKKRKEKKEKRKKGVMTEKVKILRELIKRYSD